MFENNQVKMIGKVISDFKFSHEVFLEGFYMVKMSVNRLSGQADVIPLMVSERLVDVKQDYRGLTIEVSGQFRSYNRHEGAKTRLVLSVFVCEWKIVDNPEMVGEINQIYLEGYICKPPSYRQTPLGRKIADFLVAVNRPYGRSDYIPCIAWGRNARYAATFEVGGKITIWGRVQSREYIKKIDETEEKRIAYEVSVSSILLIEGEDRYV